MFRALLMSILGRKLGKVCFYIKKGQIPNNIFNNEGGTKSKMLTNANSKKNPIF